MRLNLSTMFTKSSDTESPGGNAGWNLEAGQSKENGFIYNSKIGQSEILNGMVYNIIQNVDSFEYGSPLGEKRLILCSLFPNVLINVFDVKQKKFFKHKLQSPFLFSLIEDDSESHALSNGRHRSIFKFKKAFKYSDYSNENFYNEIDEIIGENHPWFGIEMNYYPINNNDTNLLVFNIIKGFENEKEKYINSASRKRIWNNHISIYDEYIRFSDYGDILLVQDISKPYILKSKSQNIIFYGAPGTGKSHKVNEIIKEKNAKDRTERVTFHPEYDYASFVGGYKPTMGKDNDDNETIRYEFVPQTLTKIYVDAWNAIANGEDKEFYLVIEEINRGNCAEIFGNIFQLLDRNSDYDITPSKELKEFLENEDKGLINIDFGLEGGKMKLPDNLHILATMNTSDQSLFPMDSAFKRRWDWEYIPINYSRDNNENTSANFVVKLSDNDKFSWLVFIEKVNELIKSNDNLGMDKCLGNYFIKPDIDENTISLKSFINKAIFYLWNDVFKDEMEDESIFKNKTTYEDFFPIEENGIVKVKEILTILKLFDNKENETTEE
ncbi:McrB family protein [Mesohalobacter halotolerans]|uniref:ATPase dynein-related AAA domain-containing protein n=1 Tax=Mesohalobacter halotolerans TaxID=1883405 RepID=A0A4U5TSB1_9FLAO|nr:AAA family ATPase [Mesohalobacter halotolerans]TKS57190.1 hypothetical protein FCN74_01875 [Mesohalobacter halotolerans]